MHPDLTWVAPSGAAEMLVADIDEPVVAAATRTPFEARRRVFVIERADTMNDQAANRMLKTLEEPPSFAHLVLLTDRPGEVLPTIASRCQHVRFDAPKADDVAGDAARDRRADRPRLRAARPRRRRPLRAPGLGDGPTLRAGGEAFARAALSGRLAERPWMEVLARAKGLGETAQAEVEARVAEDLVMLPQRERKRAEREGTEAAKRAARRARTEALDQALQLAGLWLRDVGCVADGAEDVVHNADRLDALREDAAGRDTHALRAGVELVDDARAALMVNPTEELLLEALASRLARLVAA